VEVLLTVSTPPSTVLLSTLFAGLADPARLSCLLTVRGQPRTVNEVVVATGLSQPNVSKHLACLRECGLLTSERSGRHVSYQFAHAGVEHLLQAAETLLSDIGETVAACPTYGQRSKQ
jgi:ArsR family transcriptional regulator, cadmium/lead-responsive transcriptional repressor